MNSGLPSLLDAIFGKNDLASVSLDEMYELINEFPSFNAGHYFLSKKLKQQNDAAYEKECMRTALYFNNAFWLQTLLDENNHNGHGEPPVAKDPPLFVEDENDGSVVLEKPEAVPVMVPESETFEMEIQHPESIPGVVTSFDELISKYKIETANLVYDSPADVKIEPVQEFVEDSVQVAAPELRSVVYEEPVNEPPVEFTANPVEEINELIATSDAAPGLRSVVHEEPVNEPPVEFIVNPVEEINEPIAPSEPASSGFIEIINEYGIFEEEVVKNPDYDLESFDRLVEMNPPVPPIIPADVIPPVPPVTSEDIPVDTRENIIENQIPETPPERPVEQDYESFDRPAEMPENDFEPVTFSEPVEISAEPMTGTDDETENTEMPYPENAMVDQMPQLADRFGDQQKSVVSFDAKKAESIVFAPYHMIDYFASQGIKLVMEDNPVDNFGKQLKSFTDWLKVLKKLPVQPMTEKPDEREVDRIRHFAAHSIEDRDILTESMAEVLAKQGMYENAIALYQKLSLIYPPKSAYFASRIEQIKASLP